MVKKYEDEDNSERKMLPAEFGQEKKLNQMVVTGAFKSRLKEKISESEFDKKIDDFLKEKSTI